MMPIPQAVNIQFFTPFIEEDGTFTGHEIMDKAANNMMDKLKEWIETLN